MLAIHNAQPTAVHAGKVANAFAKLSKCQQFTTRWIASYKGLKLQTLLQSYQNVSNSQRLNYELLYTYSCKRFCKVIKMLAIHNTNQTTNQYYNVANAFAKLSKCQQFTTLTGGTQKMIQLQTLLQSYQNVSNSQPNTSILNPRNCCKRFCKVIKMLAIHNNDISIFVSNKVANAFAKLSKCQQFTTILQYLPRGRRLQTLLQSYQNVSNSQPTLTSFSFLYCCKRFCKVIKMLAIHNYILSKVCFSMAANAFAKLSKCQQFTTEKPRLGLLFALQTLLQSYQNVSNSQPCAIICSYVISCKRFCKVIKMLAIHNRKSHIPNNLTAANAFAKLSKCQQFTTIQALLIY